MPKGSSNNHLTVVFFVFSSTSAPKFDYVNGVMAYLHPSKCEERWNSRESVGVEQFYQQVTLARKNSLVPVSRLWPESITLPSKDWEVAASKKVGTGGPVCLVDHQVISPVLSVG